MPSVTFVLPHWLYWAGLFVGPLIAIYLVRRRERRGPPRGVSLPIAYLMWLGGGYVGIHRFYLRSLWGIVYPLLFVAILYGNIRWRQARDVVSGARNDLRGAEFDVERFGEAVEKGVAGAAAKLAAAEQALVGVKDRLAEATANLEFWDSFTGGVALAIAVLLVVDAVLLPRLTRRCKDREGAVEAAPAPPPPELEPPAHVRAAGERREIHTWITDAIDAVNGAVGNFICYWSVIAVAVYYYEVIARYVFNSPTNWAHESMFLMFGMQYLISGAFALREDAHVRVDVLYQYLSRRKQAALDLFTSIFFFIFVGAMLWTGWTFAMDSIEVWEVSFTEWAIQYWPVKMAIPLGALLILLQGIAELLRNLAVFTGWDVPGAYQPHAGAHTPTV